MEVKELIEKLKKFDERAEVVVHCYTYDGYSTEEIDFVDQYTLLNGSKRVEIYV